MPGAPATTPRLDLPRFGGADPADFPAQVNALADALDLRVPPLVGTLADRPATAPGRSGRLYYAQPTTPSGVGSRASLFLEFNGAWVTLLETENWHVVGDAGEPAFQNGWVNQPDQGSVAFRRVNGVVHLRGRAQHPGAGGLMVASGATPFVLPAGYRPATRRMHVGLTAQNPGDNPSVAAGVYVWPTGEVTPVEPRFDLVFEPISFGAEV